MAVSFIVSPTDAELIGQPELRVIADTYAQELGLPDLSVELSLASPEEIRELNLEYRQLDEPTDVLSFQLLSGLEELRSIPKEANLLLGSIIICPEKAAAYEETLPQLVHHGLLHLLGLDHEQDKQAWLEQEGPLIAALARNSLDIPGIPA